MSDYPLIQVWHSKLIRGFAAAPYPGTLTQRNPEPLIETLEHLHPTDAHFVPYIVVDQEGEPERPAVQRVNQSGLVVLRAYLRDLRFGVVVMDVDCPEKDDAGQASDEWRDEFLSRYTEMPSVISHGLAWYFTRGGLRLLGILPSALSVEDYQLRHRALSLALQDHGILVDPATMDWTRCYRLPRVMRENVKQDYEMNLEPLQTEMRFKGMKKASPRKTSDARQGGDGGQPIAKGERHLHLIRLGFKLRKTKHLSDDRLADALMAINCDPLRCVEPIPAPELNDILRFICNNEPISAELGQHMLAELEEKAPLSRYSNGDLKLTPATLGRLLTEFPPLAGLFCFDEFQADVLITRELPGAVSRSMQPFPRQFEDHDVSALGVYFEQLCGRPSPAAKALKAEVERTAREQGFNSLQDALNALPPYDGKMRLGTWLINYLGAPDTEHNRLAGPMFLVQMIKRAMEPGCKADYMLVLEGRQGARKSQAVAALGGSFGGEGLPVLDLGASRAQEHIVGLHVCEIPELHTVVRKNSQAAIKAFLTTTGDRMRMPYATRSQYFPRTCVFIGTTNETNGYLKDDTGNRRYWLVSVGEVDIEGLKRDRSQLLAEALAAYREGVQSWPTDEQSEQLFAPEQAKRLGRDPWIEVLADQLRDVYEITGAECLRLLSVPVDRQGQSQLQRVGRCMQKLGWRRVNSNRDGVRCWVYQRG